MDMLRLFRHKITCLFHPDSNRWYWDLTSSAGMRTNAHPGRGLIGSAADNLPAPRHPFGTARFTTSCKCSTSRFSRKYAKGNLWRGLVAATTTFPAHPKVARLSRQSRETATGTRIPISHDLRPRRPQGRKRRGSGGVTGVSLRNIPQDAKRLRSAKRDAEPLCMSEDVPERSPRHAPGFPVGVLDLVGLSTYRRPADQR